MNIDILICTPDMRSDRFRRCLDSLKSTARGIQYNLIVRDNGGAKDFNHAREINKAMCVSEDMFITLDDDVCLTGTWLEAMLDAVTIDTGIVCTTEFKTPAQMWRRAWHCDSEGNPRRWCGDILEPTPVPAASSCCMLVSRRLLHMARMDERYKKYYFDIDYCFKAWEVGLSVKVTPEHCIHYGQQATQEIGVDISGVLNHDRELFNRTWLDSGRLTKMQNEAGYMWPEGIAW